MAKITDVNFYRKCRAIVRHLPNWRFDQFSADHGRAEIISDDKARLHLNMDWDRKRLKVYGKFLDRTYTDTITMDIKRRSADLARDIKRRIIVDYLPRHIAIKLKVKEQANQQSEINLFFGLLENLGFSKSDRTRYSDDFYNGNMRIRHRYNEEFDIKITDITPELAIKIYYFIKQEQSDNTTRA